ncbi:MAG: PilT/PilU family type 4a pilus ATPase [Proteobacteria bacterium]|nr:PilT/PilU family type 4a pilus ATPase [Pseudomonadota bacterium]
MPLLEVNDNPDDLTQPSMSGLKPFADEDRSVAPPRKRRTERPTSGPAMDMARVRSRPGAPRSAPGKSAGLKPTAQIQYTRSEATTPPDYGRKLNRDEFDRLLRWMVEQDATDLHITPRFPPTLRVDNRFQPSQGRVFDPGEIEKVIYSILGDKERKEIEERQATDLSYEIDGVGRFRINVFRQLYGTSAAVRHVGSAIESLDALNLPSELSWLTGQEAGLVLFTGPTGSGKSTSMAAIIEQMNLTRQLHILTLEASIEFLFQNGKSLIQQREVGVHTPTFLDGLRDALRENPDVIMVGELRDLDTVSMAVSAGETGHLIMATMHANTTVNAVSRLIDVFPDTQKAGARAMISDVLKAVVNLRLLRHSSGRGLVPAVDFLKINNAVATLIRDNKLHQVRQVITTASGEGMWAFEKHLVELTKRNEVDYETAYQAAPDKRVFEQYAQSYQEERDAARKATRKRR